MFSSPVSILNDMQYKFIVLAISQLAAVLALEARDAPAVLTAVRVYNTIINQPPYLVEATSTVVWTQSPSVSVDEPTTAPTPTILD